MIVLDVAFILNQTAVGIIIAAVVWLFRQTSKNQQDINEFFARIREVEDHVGIKPKKKGKRGEKDIE